MPLDLGINTFNRRVLLLGAGFSKNWGGPLADQVWHQIFGHAAVKARPALKLLLTKERSFEVAIHEARTNSNFSQEDVAALELAVRDVFERMDRTFREPARPVAGPTINDLLSRFCPGAVGMCSGYVFSLNQDQLVERIYGTQVNKQKLDIPGVKWLGQHPGFPAHMDDIPEAEPLDPRTTPITLANGFQLIKLHGSMNWRSPQGTRQMVIGGGKLGMIESSPLLSYYFQVFREVLSLGGVRLMVIGYGWRDDHVNDVIADAVSNHGLEIYPWSPAHPIDALKAPDVHRGEEILAGLMGSASQPLAEAMPVPMNPITEEYKRIVGEFF